MWIKKIFSGLIGALLLSVLVHSFEMAWERITLVGGVEATLHDLRSKDPKVRLSAARALYDLKSPKSERLLVLALNDPEPEVGEMAALALSEIKDAHTVDLLLTALKNEEARVRALAALALGRIRNPLAIDSLIAALKDKSEEVRWQAVRALAAFEDPRPLRPIIDKLKDESPSIRMNAVETLGKLKDPRLDPLAASLKDQSLRVRFQALSALQEIEKQVERAVDSFQLDIASLSSRKLAEVGEWVIFGPDGKEKGGIGKGRCPVCHAFQKGDPDRRAPNLYGATKRARERVKEFRYQHPDTVQREAFPGSGRADTAIEYIAESKVCPSCYVVEGYGEKGSDDRESPGSPYHKGPLPLTIHEMIAVDAWLYLHDGENPPPVKEMRAAYEKFIPSGERKY